MAGDQGISSRKHTNPGDDKRKDIITVRSNQKSRISKVKLFLLYHTVADNFECRLLLRKRNLHDNFENHKKTTVSDVNLKLSYVDVL